MKMLILLLALSLSYTITANPKCGSTTREIIGKDTVEITIECNKSGDWTIWREVNGELHDSIKSFYSNGAKKQLSIFKYGKEHGVRQGWTRNGFLSGSQPYRDGKPYGRHEEWYSQGKPKQVTHFNDDGHKHGLEETWREDGTRQDSVFYVNGKMAESMSYYSNGKPRVHERVDEDFKLVTGTSWDPKGKITGTIRNGSGTWVIYSDDAKLVSRETYKNGKRIQSVNLKTP